MEIFWLILSILIFFLFYRKNTAYEHDMNTRSLFEIIKNRNRFLEWITECMANNRNHTITVKGIGRVGRVFTANPANVEHVLKTKFTNYPKGETSIDMLEDFFGHGIFNSDGEQWQWQRKAASFEFNKRSLRNFLVEVVQYEIVHRLLPLLTKAADEDKMVDLQQVLERFMFDNICKVAFDEDPACLVEEPNHGNGMTVTSKFMKAFEDAENNVIGRFRNAFQITWKIKRLLNIGSERQLKESISTVHDYAMNIIKARKGKDLDEYHDLLSRFASNKDTSEEFLRDIVISFIVAGRDTTSSALVWFFWILSARPDVKEKIIQEVKRIRVSNEYLGDTFSYDELREMHYLHAALTESMRLFPPVPADSISCLDDDMLPDGTLVRKGWFVTYSAYTMARLEDLWGKDCNVYNPERWLENGIFKPESSFRYPVFHAGPRVCLGKEMAYIQMKSVVAGMIERFEVDILKKEKTPEYVLSMTMRMKEGLPIKLRKHSSS